MTKSISERSFDRGIKTLERKKKKNHDLRDLKVEL